MTDFEPTDAVSTDEPQPEIETVESDEAPPSEQPSDTTLLGSFLDSVHDIMTLEFLRNPAVRETKEFAVMLVILWMLLRGFEVEPFVIPTGSMAPTLQGRHHDVECPQCKFQYRSGASRNPNGRAGDSEKKPNVEATTCPICRFRLELDKVGEPDHRAFSGDRILVSKFAYDLADPERWDIAVFKFPRDPKTNYIKRLVGLPGETIRISNGDIYYLSKHDKMAGQTEFKIARKPPKKLLAMLQVVDDTHHIPQTLVDAGWPSRWQSWGSGDESLDASWSKDSPSQFSCSNSSDEIQWLRYRHLVPGPNSEGDDWQIVLGGELPRDLAQRSGQLITDYYAYNDGIFEGVYDRRRDLANLGTNWVGDLVVEYDIEIKSATGEVWLDLVEGGTHYQCSIDLASGSAELMIDGADEAKWGDEGETMQNPTATTALRGGGEYRARFANVDNELRLWIDDEVVEFDGPTTYSRSVDEVVPACEWHAVTSPLGDPLDLAPAGIGVRKGASLTATRLRVLRDIYYTIKTDKTNWDVLRDHNFWNGGLFDSPRPYQDFVVGDSHYLPLGDNSPQSADGREWSDRLVPRRLLTGKAVFLYWPHTWNEPIPFMPNFRRMGFIR